MLRGGLSSKLLLEFDIYNKRFIKTSINLRNSVVSKSFPMEKKWYSRILLNNPLTSRCKLAGLLWFKQIKWIFKFWVSTRLNLNILI